MHLVNDLIVFFRAEILPLFDGILFPHFQKVLLIVITNKVIRIVHLLDIKSQHFANHRELKNVQSRFITLLTIQKLTNFSEH